MRSQFLIMALLGFSSSVLAQNQIKTEHGLVTRISTPKFRQEEDDSNIITLPMAFNGAVSTEKIRRISARSVQSVSLVYTQFKLKETFNQMELNAKRTYELFRQIPSLKGKPEIQWYWVEQTGCSSPGECQEFFHGFVIVLKPKEAMMKARTEIALLDFYLSALKGTEDSREVDSLIKTGKLSYIKKCDTQTLRVRRKGSRFPKIRGIDGEFNRKLGKIIRKELNREGAVQLTLKISNKGKITIENNHPENRSSEKLQSLLVNYLRATPARFNNKRIESRADLHVMLKNGRIFTEIEYEPLLPEGQPYNEDEFLYSYEEHIRCNYIDTSAVASTSIADYWHSFSTEKVILKVFDRNKNWSNCLVITDVTGSMYPYLAQFLQWHSLHLKATGGNHDFVFFNDGDNRPDNTKSAGAVGGLYYIKTSKFDELDKKMRVAMLNGGGGDGPENNIEAVLHGLEKNNSIKEVIMIADNWATPRDLSLLSKVKVPIRLVLCGTTAGFNTEYLNMVRLNGGSIHTVEEDIYNLSSMAENSTLSLGKFKYRLEGGVFKSSWAD